MEEKELKRLFELAHFRENDPDETWLSCALDEALMECVPLKPEATVEKANKKACLREDAVKKSVSRTRLFNGEALTLPEEDDIF